MASVQGNLIDILNKKIYPASVFFEDGIITGITEISEATHYILPGFIDSHIHIESSMLIPSEFARLAVVHGTVATVSDPHEIGNVLGVKGVDFMIHNGAKVPFKFNFGAPSCVPATPFETAGAEITAADINRLLSRDEIKYLSEMMNWPGVISRDDAVMQKIRLAAKHKKPVDGHAPGLKGDQADACISAGISTDHECFTYDEALHKIKSGMKISIREGSAARNFEALCRLIDEYPDMVMLCSDDKHPDELASGHINKLVSKAIDKGIDLFNVLKAACINPVLHYNLNVGMLREGNPADFIILKDLNAFEVIQTRIEGIKVAENGKSLILHQNEAPINNFNISPISPSAFRVEAKGNNIRVIEAFDGQLITYGISCDAKTENGEVVSNTDSDVLKMVVLNRYFQTTPAVAFIKNIGLKEGAIASSVGHDSHNIIAVGVDDDSLAKAINLIIKTKGGVSAVGYGRELLLPLPFAGLMSGDDGYNVASSYIEIDRFAKKLGSGLRAPFMTLSFMALLVIPDLKLSDKGLFSGNKFEFVDLFC